MSPISLYLCLFQKSITEEKEEESEFKCFMSYLNEKENESSFDSFY